MSQPPLVTSSLADHVAVVTLTGTTMPPAFYAQLEATFRDLAERADLRAVIVHGAGKAFSYGLDLAAAFAEWGELFSGGTAARRTELLRLIRRLQAAFTAVEACPVPVIAAIHGWCIGGGLDLASACDVRLASRDARFSLRETKVAIVADLGSLQRLPRLIGQGHTRELAFTGKDIDAEHALRIGLVSSLHAYPEATLEAARQMAAEIAANPPLTVRGVKEVLAHGDGRTVAEGLETVALWNSAFLASEDLGEAVAAFAARRPPAYQGR